MKTLMLANSKLSQIIKSLSKGFHMPPLKGIDRGLNGEALKALEESGHGDQIAIVDASYAIPKGAEVIDYLGATSADALRGILQLVPVDEPVYEYPEIIIMAPDEGDDRDSAMTGFLQVMGEIGNLRNARVPRLDSGITAEDELDLGKGFYSLANDPEKNTIFFRTRDKKAYACAMFVVGHSQE